jgi:hypothetical protein
MSVQDALAAVAAIIRAAPDGVISHQALVDELEAQGNTQAIAMLQRLADTGEVTAKVVAVPDGKPELRYSLPGQPAASPAETAPPQVGA